MNYFKVKYGLQHDIYRISNVYGEEQNTSKGLGAINTFIEKIMKDGKVVVFGDGEIVRNYIYVKFPSQFFLCQYFYKQQVAQSLPFACRKIFNKKNK